MTPTTKPGSGNEISLEVDWSEPLGMLASLAEVWPRAAARAINRALARQRTQVVRRVSQETRVKPQRLIRRRMKLDPAKVSTDPVGRLRILTSPVRASALAGVTDTRIPGTREGQGVTASGGHRWPDAFLAHGTGRRWMAFERRGRPRLPLDAVRVEIQTEGERILAEELRGASEFLARELPRQIVLLAKQRGTGSRSRGRRPRGAR